MRRQFPWLTLGLLILLAAIAFLRLRPHSSRRTPAPSMQGEPTWMLWAWESPQDLRQLDPTRAGVAYLSRELLLGSSLEIRERHQPLLVPPGTFLVPVVRIETASGFKERTANIPSIAAQIASALEGPNTHALQVDFDARASERPFYSALLHELRRQLPPHTSLSITALTSWCGRASWLHSLPIDEAVPMFFRMGGPSTLRASAPRSFAGIQEPLCTGSVGVATDERWPSLDFRQRVYVFPVGSWRAEDLAFINVGGYAQLQRAAAAPSQGPP